MCDSASTASTSPTVSSSTGRSGCFFAGGGLDRPKRMHAADGERQVGRILKHQARVVPCSPSGDEVPSGAHGAGAQSGAASHFKVQVQKVQCAERHRNLETGNFDWLAKPQYQGATLGKVSKLVLEVGGTMHELVPKGGRLEVILAQEVVSLPAKAALSMEYESLVVSTSSKECPWFAGDYEFALDFQEPGPDAGCCVIA